MLARFYFSLFLSYLLFHFLPAILFFSFIPFSFLSYRSPFLPVTLPRIRVLRVCLFPLAGFAFYFLLSFPFHLFLYLLIPSTHSSLFFLMTNQDFWECILAYCTPGVHKPRAPTRPGDYIFFTVAPNILVPSNETCFMTLFWRLVYYSGFRIFF